MNNCLNCNKEVKNKYCNFSCQNTHQSVERNNKRYGIFKYFTVSCYSCGKDVVINEREKLYPKMDKYFCNRSCANRRTHTNESKDIIRQTLLLKDKIKLSINCLYCNKFFTPKQKTTKFCSKNCNSKYQNTYNNRGRLAGLASVATQKETRRSKNEIYFFELCKNYFKVVLNNEPIFNGWDADVIIEDYKIAVLWNGRWHYEKITQKHSVLQVQNRDKIKIKEILKCGYIPYVVKDMGKYNLDFTKKEFEKLKLFLEAGG